MKFSTLDTPAGPFSWVTDDGAVAASGWTTDPHYLFDLARLGRPELTGDDPDTAAAVADFIAGDTAALDRVRVRQRSGEFIQHAWDVLRTVPAGRTITYTEYAALAGRPAAVRAAASACATNRCALFVPCHRVLRSDGSLGGFRYGLDAKRAMIDFEATLGDAILARP
ncbi:methylated-DNA--[protein]-cysteine S-methyltransferase [Aestuariimicrobium ganziense]|uniref:methylated-DNA--[protein]-cysteine S-methyltransferase n=1 Tax=Aestuariimicrobium ganziense TaxID=2773677 RepID=UPI001940D9F0|nr:methylated-DNA--[protein]-cysteine S-methyltransferase [Aestuariimicrobium ganziense]